MGWDLSHILGEDTFESLCERVHERISRLRRRRYSSDMKKSTFTSYVTLHEKVISDLYRLLTYASLLEGADLKNQHARYLQAKAQDCALAFEDATRDFWHWVAGKGGLDERNARRLFSAAPRMRYHLNRMRDQSRYMLSQGEERIADYKDATTGSSLNHLRTLITGEFEYYFKPGKKGRIITTTAELTSYMQSDSPDKRRAAYRSLLDKHREHLDKLFVIYQSVAKDWVQMSNIRGFSRPISMRNHANDISDEATDTLLSVIQDNKRVFHKHFRYKAHQLGQKKLSRYDIYAPLHSGTRHVSFDQAQQLVLDTFATFSTSFYQYAKKVMDEGHLDAFPRRHKREGAFCANVTPGIVPYVLLNYNRKETDVFALAHELGHAVHAQMASANPPSVQDPPLPLAETASTLAELLVFEKLYSTASIQQKKSMLAHKVSESYATILLQAYFTIFEMRAHEAITRGTTAEELSDMYLKTQREQYGNAVQVDDIFRYGWARIPHIFEVPFYCYAYGFGELLSLSLYARYRREGSSFTSEIERILSYGGSKNPQKVLAEVGIDVKDKGFWKEGFEVIKGWQRELERL